ncbi:MAG TPA: tetratricopeptide repeat protein [Anaerolineaceae bacterium]|nr:tetratricopeptide repeat protein [Anaerolineaceae bacterium]
MRNERKLWLLFFLLLPLGFMAFPKAGAAPENLTLSLQNDRAALVNGDAQMELTAIQQALEFQTWRGDLWQRAGRLYMDQGDYQNALHSFEKAQELGQLEPLGQVWLSDMLIANGYSDVAKYVLQSIHTDDVFILLQAAALMAPLNDHEGLRQLLQKAYASEPTNSEVNYQMGIYLMTEDPGRAVAYFELAKRDQSRKAAAAYLVENIQQYGALEDHGEWYLYAGQALARINEWNAAFQAFSKAVQSLPDNAIALALLGESQFQLGLDGRQNLEKAWELDPEGEITNGVLGIYYQRQGNLEKALEHLRIAQKSNPSAAIWILESGRTLAAMGDLEKALTEFSLAVTVDEKNADLWRVLAEFCVLHRYQLEDVGLPAARQALTLEPDNPVLMDLLGTVYLQLADLDSAERFFLRALERDPEQAAILIHLGQLNLIREEKEIAFGYLRRAEASARDWRLRDLANRLLRENGAQ